MSKYKAKRLNYLKMRCLPKPGEKEKHNQNLRYITKHSLKNLTLEWIMIHVELHETSWLLGES